MKKTTGFLIFFTLFLLDVSAQCPNYSRPGVHVVQSGENIYRIAKRYNISTVDLAQWNNIAANMTVYACQELLLSNTNTYQNSAPVYTPSDEFTARGSNNVDTYTERTFVKQAGNKHVIREGETIDGLANLYGYTSERFRKINLLGPNEELSVGSSILSTDCACDRVVSYEEMNGGYVYTKPSANTNNYNNSTRTSDNFQTRGGTDYDSFYDSNPGSVSVNNASSTEPISYDRIRSGQSSTTTYDNNAYDRPSSVNRRNAAAPSPARATYMSNDELAMLDEINLMRSNPSGYITYVEAYRRDIQSGKTFGSSLPVIDELIAELRRTPTLSILEPTPCIYEAARKHGLDQKSRGYTGHDGSDGSWPWDRVKSECKQMGLNDGNENLVGGLSDVRESVILLLVDDGIKSRGHRKTLLEPKWTYGATYKIGKVGHMPNCWVQKFGAK